MTDEAPKTWEVHYDANDDVVVSTIRGYATTEDLMASAIARISLDQEMGTKHFVLDTGGFLPSDRSSFEAIYETVTKSYPTMFVDRTTKLAVIPPESEDARWFMDFFQSMCDSRGTKPGSGLEKRQKQPALRPLRATTGHCPAMARAGLFII